MTYGATDKTDAGKIEHPFAGAGIGCFKERLKTALGSRSLRSFSRECGLSEATLRSYLAGDTYPTLDRLEQISAAAGVAAIWLAFGSEAGEEEAGKPVPSLADDEQYALIPLYDARCSAGHGSWNEGCRVLTQLAFTRYSLRKKGLEAAQLSAIRVDGDSMEGLLKDGDTVLLDHRRNALEGEAVYVIRLDDHLYAKRLQRQFDGSVHIISQNKAYQTMVVPRERLGELEIIGRVVWSAGWMI